MANRIEIEFRDGGMVIFDDDPYTTVDWNGDRAKVVEGDGDTHWFTDIRYVWQDGKPVQVTATFTVSQISVANLDKLFFQGGKVIGAFDYARP